jgi:predicted lipoprotein with Yx(FWY)xxD motif
VRHRAARAGTILLSAGVLAAAMTAPALATSHYKAKAKKGTEISSIAATAGTAKLGRVLASSKGRVMYLFTKDKTTASRCTGACATAWPKVTSATKPRADKGVLAKQLGRNKKHQVTYYGHPLYYFISDKKAGKATGENEGGFLVVSLHGKGVKPPKNKPTKPPTPLPKPTGAVGTGTAGGKTVLVDSNRFTLYELDVDAPPAFGCTTTCLSAWKPLLVSGAPTASGDANAAMLGTVTRTINSAQVSQVTYNGRPLYEFKGGDTAPGQDNGQYAFFDASYWRDMFASGLTNQAFGP